MTVANPKYADMRWNMEENRWESVKQIIGETRVLAGPQLSQQILHAPEHLGMVIARYRAAAALIGDALSVVEVGCGEGIGAGILARHREMYVGSDTDRDAIAVAAGHLDQRGRTDRRRMSFVASDIVNDPPDRNVEPPFEAAVSLDVIEHIPAEHEARFLANIGTMLTDHGVCVIGTPSKHAEHLASPQSKIGHVNLFTPERLKALMARYFHVVQAVYMQDVAIHLGHPAMAHYLIAVGIGPKRG